MRFTPSIVILALAALASPHARADTRIVYVDASRPTDGDGTTWTNAFRNLQAAFDSVGSLSPEQAANLDVHFRIAGGTYRAVQNWAPAFRCPASLDLAQSLTLTGGFAGANSPTPDARNLITTPTILSADVLGNDGSTPPIYADNALTVLTFAHSDEFESTCADHLVIDGLNFQGGNKQDSQNYYDTGSAVSGVNPASINGDATCRFVDCTFTGNRGQSAVVALGITDATLNSCLATFERCTFDNNECQEAPSVVHASAFFSLDFTDCVFTANRALSVQADGRLTMRRSRVQGNYGGIYSTSAGADVSYCLFSHNHGTAVFLTGHPSISNCTIVANDGYFGGGIFVDGRLSIEYCIVVDNFAYQQGHQIAGNWSAPRLLTSIATSGPGDMYFPFASDTPIRSLPFTAIFRDADGPDNDPDTWQDNDYRLHPHSQAIDAGSNFLPSTALDLDGNPTRVQGITGRGPRADLGCYESQLSLCPADINADNAVTIDDLLAFLSHFELGQPLADLTTNGSTPFPDGGVTIDDLLYFLLRFEAGC